MSLADSLKTAKPYKTSRPCGVSRLLRDLSKKDRDALEATLSIGKGEPGRLSSQQISDILKTEGHNISMKVIEVHRKGACACDSRG